jgi:hypothetical protein
MHQHLVFIWVILKIMALLIIVMLTDDHHDLRIIVDRQDTQDIIDHDQDQMKEVLFILPAKNIQFNNTYFYSID